MIGNAIKKDRFIRWYSKRYISHYSSVILHGIAALPRLLISAFFGFVLPRVLVGLRSVTQMQLAGLQSNKAVINFDRNVAEAVVQMGPFVDQSQDAVLFVFPTGGSSHLLGRKV